MDAEVDMQRIIDNPRHSARLRNWARDVLIQIAEIRAAAEAEIPQIPEAEDTD